MFLKRAGAIAPRMLWFISVLGALCAPVVLALGAYEVAFAGVLASAVAMVLGATLWPARRQRGS